jgi:hypothetical protein
VETLALRIEDRLKHHKYCTVFEGELDRVWPREHSNDPRIPLIEKFAREHGWSVTFRDPGIRAVFRQAAAASAPPPRLRQRGNSRL